VSQDRYSFGRDGELFQSWEKPELYDLAIDRAETTNLAGQQPDVITRLTAAAIAWHQSMPADNGPKLEPESPPNPTKTKKKAHP
jgi:hypothetical protein